MKVSLSIKPKTVTPYDESAVLLMAELIKIPSLPKGIPIPKVRTKVAIFISSKQWRRLGESAGDPSDTLFVDGVPTFHESFKGIIILATSVKSKKLEASKRACASSTD